MRRIALLSTLALTLFGGVAAADRHDNNRHDRRDDRSNRYDRGRDNRPGYIGHRPGGVVVRGDIRTPNRIRYRDYRNRPAIRFETYSHRRGFVWVAGQWNWDGYEWLWTPGHYVRARATWR